MASPATPSFSPSSTADNLSASQFKYVKAEKEETLTEINQHIPPPLPLPHRQRHDTAQIVVIRTPLLLTKVPHEPRAKVVCFGDHVEQKRLDVVEEGFMVQEHLGEETEVLAVDLYARMNDVRYKDSSTRDGRKERRALFFLPSTSNTEIAPSR